MRLSGYFRLIACRNARIIIFFLLLCVWSVWEYNLPFGPFYRYDINDGYKSKCCGVDSILNVCRWPFCEPCKVSDVTGIKKDSKNVFFIETSKSNELNARQACAVESAALQNPNLNIFTLMTGIPNNNSTSMGALSSYSNIHIRHIELGDYFLHTPLEQWYFCTKWNYGSYAISHLSDALRFLTLYKYGGYYFDLDFVMLKSVEKYQNFLAPESRLFLAAGAIHLEPDHPLIERAVEEFLNTYKRGDWGYNGPQLLTRVMKTWCHVEKLSMMTTASCRGVTVLPIEYFYPVHWLNWETLFSNVSKPEDFGGSLAAHLWNKFSHSFRVIKDSNQLYNLLAKENCPHVHTFVENEF